MVGYDIVTGGLQVSILLALVFLHYRAGQHSSDFPPTNLAEHVKHPGAL